MKNRKIAKSALGVLLAGCMVMGSVPVSTGVRTYAGTTEGAAESVSNPLTTKWNEAEIGTHTDKGSYTYDKEAQKISIAGSGTKFDKDSAKDDLYYAFLMQREQLQLQQKYSCQRIQQVDRLVSLQEMILRVQVRQLLFMQTVTRDRSVMDIIQKQVVEHLRSIPM